MSRWVIRPASRSFSQTGSGPTSRSRILHAASRSESSGETQSGFGVMMSLSFIDGFLRMASASLALLVMLLLVVLHHGARGHLLGAAAVAARLLGRLLDVLVLALLPGADALQVLRLVLLGHGVGLRIGSSGPPHLAAGRRYRGRAGPR